MNFYFGSQANKGETQSGFAMDASNLYYLSPENGAYSEISNNSIHYLNHIHENVQDVLDSLRNGSGSTSTTNTNVSATLTAQTANINGRLFVGGDASFNANVSIGKDLHIGGDLIVDGNEEVKHFFVVDGSALFMRLVTMKENLYLTGNDADGTGTMWVGGQSHFDSLLEVKKNLYVTNGDVSFNQRLYVNSDASFNHNVDIAGTLRVKQLLIGDNTSTGDSGITFDSALNVNDALYVQKDAVFDQRVDVFGDVSMAKTLTVVRATTLGNTLSVAGNATLNQKLAVWSDVSMGGNLRVDKAVDISGAFHARATAQIDGTLDVTGATTLGNTLSVTKLATLSSGLTVAGDASFNSRLYVNGDATLNGALTVDKAANFHSGVTFGGAITMNDNLTVAANKSTTLNGGLTVGSSTATSLTGTLGVTGAADFANTLSVNNGSATTLTGTLEVDGASTLYDSLTVANNSATTLTGTLAVTQSANLSDTLYVSGDASFNSKMYVKQDASFGGVMNIGSLQIAPTFGSGAGARQNALVAQGATTDINIMPKVGGKAYIRGDLWVDGSLNITGDFHQVNTTTTVTESFTVENNGTTNAFKVLQRGGTPVADFQYGTSGNEKSSLFIDYNGFVGIGGFNHTAPHAPTYNLDVSGIFHTSGDIEIDGAYHSDTGKITLKDGNLELTNGILKVLSTSVTSNIAGQLDLGKLNMTSGNIVTAGLTYTAAGNNGGNVGGFLVQW
jgi:predicted acyltransferase (DUF342 family)